MGKKTRKPSISQVELEAGKGVCLDLIESIARLVSNLGLCPNYLISFAKNGEVYAAIFYPFEICGERLGGVFAPQAANLREHEKRKILESLWLHNTFLCSSFASQEAYFRDCCRYEEEVEALLARLEASDDA